MPLTTLRHYNTRKLNIIFACSCVALLLSIVWLIKVEYSRPWRGYQDDFTDLEETLAYFDALAAGESATEPVPERSGWINVPLFDFLAPRGTPGKNEIKQVVLPDVRTDLHFTETATTDRCMTCHVGIDNKNFTKDKIAHRLSGVLAAVDDRVKSGSKARLELTELERLKETGGDRYFEAVIDRINDYQSARKRSKIKIEQPLFGHPKPDLYVGSDSPHPLKTMGCTVCHEGSGEETDFVLSAHTPASQDQLDQWKEKHYVKSAGLVPEFTFQTAAAGWNRPMLPHIYLQAGCVKCHYKVADISMYDWKSTATLINKGRHLATSLGCVNCHLVGEFADRSKVGPDLSHVGEKLTEGFLHNWIWFPKDYRPSTNMPHFFQQENSDARLPGAGDGDPVLRTRTEVIALSKYLLAVSDSHDRVYPPEELWNPLKDENGVSTAAAADRGRRLFGSVGCLSCHVALAYRRDDKEYGGLLDPVGATWIVEHMDARLQPVASNPELARERGLDEVASAIEKGSSADDIQDAIWEYANRRYERMSYVDRVEYAMNNFSDYSATFFGPREVTRPVFTRYGPELSSIRTKFPEYEQAVEWIYDWLKNPRHYSSYTRMPKLRLLRGRFSDIDSQTHQPTGMIVDADEALDVAIYLSGLNQNKRFSQEPFDSRQVDRRIFTAERDELVRLMLARSHSPAEIEAVITDKSGELTDELVSKLSKSMDRESAEAKIRATDLEQRRWLWLGQRLIGHYGCYACHQIRGFEASTGPGPELTEWAEKPVGQLDFGYFAPVYQKSRSKGARFIRLYPPDRKKLLRWARNNPVLDMQSNRTSFALHKLRNPRMWYRGQDKLPYDKLKMPNFFVTQDQAVELVTFLLSRKGARVNKNLQVDYDNTPAGWIADGRNLAWEYNCVGCHVIDGNVAALHQYYLVSEGRERVFDEVNIPPWQHGHGVRVRGDWLHGYLHDVTEIRPWLKVRMPSYNLSEEQLRKLLKYYAGLCQDQSDWLKERADIVRKHSGQNDKTDQDAYQRALEGLKRYASVNRWGRYNKADPQELLDEADLYSRVYGLEGYPFSETPVEPPSADEIADGETLFYELKCLTCHIFGDPTAPGANPFPSAPNLQNVARRLNRQWVPKWLARPSRFMPATNMPMHFGENLEGAFVDYLPEHRDALSGRLNNQALLDDGIKQIEAITGFLFDAGEKKLNKVQPPVEYDASRLGREVAINR